MAGTTPGPPCSVGVALAAMKEEDRLLLESAASRPEVRKSDLARALRDAGHPVSAWSLRHHYRKDCSCSAMS